MLIRSIWFCGLSVATLYLLLACSICMADTFSYIAYDPPNEPHHFAKGSQNLGINGDILAEIGKITGDNFEVHYYPVARALYLFDHGLIDIEPGISPQWRNKSSVKALYSVPFGNSTEVVLFSPGNKIAITEPQVLFGKQVGIVRGYSYPKYDNYFDTGDIIKINNVSETLLLKQLLHGRLQQIFIGLQTILYMQKTHPEYRQFEIGDVISELPVMLRIQPSKADALPRINAAISQLLANGTIKKIYQKYAYQLVEQQP
jgi:polar amino acid transport system substrate-binding protein